MSIRYEWDAAKAKSNARKHGVKFEEAASVFLDPMAMSGPDPDHSESEIRFITFGYSSLGQLLVVSHTWRMGHIRIISARRADRSERKMYEEG
jgi:uncharacterized protein